MKRQAIVILMCLVIFVGFMACESKKTNDTTQDASAAPKASYTIRIGTPTAGKHFQNFTAEQFKAAVETATEGKIIVQIYPSSQLGTVTQMIQGVQDGSIEAVIVPSSYFSPFAPAVAVTDIPYFFETREQIFEILNDKNNPLNAYMEKKGFKVAGWLKNTPRYIMSQKKYTSMRDLSNQKIWCLPSSTLQDELLAYSAAPQILDPSDISVALENHTVDAVETDAIFMNSMGLGQSAKYLNRIPATPMINPFCFSYDWFEKLPKEYQDLLLATAQDIIRNQEAEYVDTVYEASLNGLQNAGVEIVETNTALLVELKSAAESVKTKFIATDADCASIYQELLKTIEAK